MNEGRKYLEHGQKQLVSLYRGKAKDNQLGRQAAGICYLDLYIGHVSSVLKMRVF